MTVAPSSHNASGATLCAAPFAQSTTIFKPSRRVCRGKEDLRRSIYRKRPSSTRLARPICSGSINSTPLATNASISVSAAFDSLKPSGPKNLIPLSIAGLWLAEIITPRSARIERVRNPTAGVGTGPSKSTFIPVLVKPAVKALSNIYPERRVSLPITTRCTPLASRLK